MDVLSRVRDLLNGKKSQKRKSSITEDYELDRNKKIRMSELNGDSDSEPFVTNSTASLRNHLRRSDSFLKNTTKPSYLSSGLYNQTYERNDDSSGYNFSNGTDSLRSEFKQPMPPRQTNGTRRVPALMSATKQVFDRGMFNRGPNQPHQTITPHYNRFGEPSELGNFKSVPDLYPIRANRSAANLSCTPTDNRVNGHGYSLFNSSKFGNSQRYDRSGFANPSMSSTSSLIGGPSILENSFNRTSNTMNLRENNIFPNTNHADPPKNLTRTRYQSMLDMIPGYKFLTKSKKPTNNEASIQGTIDLSEEGNQTNSSCTPVPNVERVNSLKTRLETKEIFNDNWEQRLSEKYSAKILSRHDSLKQLQEVNDECERKTRDTEERLKDSFNKITISSIVPEDEEEEEPVNDYPPLDTEKQKRVCQWISGRDTGTVLMSKFNLQISRHDIQTLQWNPLTWLNDEVINFYMELLAERSKQNEKLPKVHGMNTFFLKRLMETGYSGVRRWTRKVDIFAHDVIPVPVHKGIHWCMAIIHLKNKTIKYYDSMGAPNNPVLNALAEYLKQESLDKKKVEFDMKGWTMENVRNIPQQENGSDCGVFSCMYAEFVTRNRPIVFSQQHMSYFRMKMIYEICTGQMLN